jgi:hypothetical protein
MSDIHPRADGIQHRGRSDRESWCNVERHRPWRGRRADDTSAGNQSSSEPESKHDDSTIERIKGLPTSIGVILMAAGVVGLILPGPIGTPLLVAGGLVVAPKAFGKLDAYMKTRYPGVRHHGVKLIERFLDDMQKRYPDEPKAGT